MKIVLATASPTRQKIFSNLGISFFAHPTDIDETVLLEENLDQAISRLAKEKAAKAMKHFEREKEVFIFAFDSLVAVDGVILGKPKDEEECFQWFQKYRGKKVDAFSGVGIMGKHGGKLFQSSFVEKSWIHFRADSTDEQIRQFLAVGDWKGKAGGITVEGAGAWLVNYIEGDFPNVLGVPVQRIGEELRNLGIEPLEVLY
jgi:septum formation protein